MKIKALIMALAFVVTFAAAPVFANDCDDDVAAIQAVIDFPPADIDPINLEKAKELFKFAKEGCYGVNGGMNVDTEAALKSLQEIKTLLGI